MRHPGHGLSQSSVPQFQSGAAATRRIFPFSLHYPSDQMQSVASNPPEAVFIPSVGVVAAIKKEASLDTENLPAGKFVRGQQTSSLKSQFRHGAPQPLRNSTNARDGHFGVERIRSGRRESGPLSSGGPGNWPWKSGRHVHPLSVRPRKLPAAHLKQLIRSVSRLDGVARDPPEQGEGYHIPSTVVGHPSLASSRRQK